MLPNSSLTFSGTSRSTLALVLGASLLAFTGCSSGSDSGNSSGGSSSGGNGGNYGGSGNDERRRLRGNDVGLVRSGSAEDEPSAPVQRQLRRYGHLKVTMAVMMRYLEQVTLLSAQTKSKWTGKGS